LTYSQAFDNLDRLKTQEKPRATSNNNGRTSEAVHNGPLTFLRALDRFGVLRDEEEQNITPDNSQTAERTAGEKRSREAGYVSGTDPRKTGLGGGVGKPNSEKTGVEIRKEDLESASSGSLPISL
jgi:hypothetical protein